MRAFISDWEAARRDAEAGRAVVLLPRDAEPADLDWRCCAGADVLLRWRCTETDRERAHHLAVELVRAGAALVLSCETTGGPQHRMAAYRREVGGA